MTPRLHRPRRPGRVVLARCEDAREAVSARYDGEPPAVPLVALDEHLAACPACRRFERDIAHLERRTCLGTPAGPIAPGLHATVTTLFDDVPPAGAWRLRRAALTSRRAGRQAARWSAATVPAALLVVAGLAGTGAAPPHHAAAHRPPMCSPKVLEW